MGRMKQRDLTKAYIKIAIDSGRIPRKYECNFQDVCEMGEGGWNPPIFFIR